MSGRIRVSDFTSEELYNKYRRAIEDGNFDNVEKFLRDYNLPKDDTGVILLHYAVSYANSGKVTEDLKQACAKIVTLMVKDGKIPIDSMEQQMTPLHKACQQGHTEMVATIIALNPDLNKRTSNQQTAVHLSSTANVLSLLVAAGANLNALDKFGQTKLHLVPLEPSSETNK